MGFIPAWVRIPAPPPVFKIRVLSENIKRARNKKGVSQDRLSKMADVVYSTIIKIEPGTIQNPTIETMAKIAKVLDVKAGDLIK